MQLQCQPLFLLERLTTCDVVLKLILYHFYLHFFFSEKAFFLLLKLTSESCLMSTTPPHKEWVFLHYIFSAFNEVCWPYQENILKIDCRDKNSLSFKYKRVSFFEDITSSGFRVMEINSKQKTCEWLS